MHDKLPIIQDRAIIAVSRGGIYPVGEAPTAGSPEPSSRMTSIERQDTFQRLEESIHYFMDIAQKKHEDNFYRPGTWDVDENYITRLSSNEFFFYTKEPLTLKEFEKLQNSIAEKAKTMSAGVQLILGSFAVQTNAARPNLSKVMNVTPHITCGTSPDFHFVVKNHTSAIDVRYKIPDSKGGTDTLPALDIGYSTSASIFLPEIKVNNVARKFTFNNVIHCKTPGGVPFITAIDICLDHRRAVAKENYNNLVGSDPAISMQPVSHVIVANTIAREEEKCIGWRVMHVDPRYSHDMCNLQSISSHPIIGFGNTYFNIIDVKPQQVNRLIQKNRHSIKNNYAYKSTERSVPRDHKGYTATVDKIQDDGTQAFNDFKSKYQHHRGDYLKEQILEDMKKRIENTTTLPELRAELQKLKDSPEYRMLKIGQGWFTQTFKIKTSSEKSFEDMIAQQEKYIVELEKNSTNKPR